MNLDRERDRQLAEQLARDRDASAFHDRYVAHIQKLYCIALRLTDNASDAEDFVHVTWIRAVGAMSRFRGDSSLRTWLTSILINRCRENFRGRRELSLDDSAELVASPPVTELCAIEEIDLERSIAAMPNRYREMFVLHDIEGFTHAVLCLGTE